MMRIKLTSEEKIKLEQAHRNERDGKVRDRIKTIEFTATSPLAPHPRKSKSIFLGPGALDPLSKGVKSKIPPLRSV